MPHQSQAQSQERCDYSVWQSALFNAFVATERIARRPKLGRAWWRAWHGFRRRCAGVVRTTVYGAPVYAPFNYSYPVTVRQCRAYNNPLLELVWQVHQWRRRTLAIVDIGAGIGDTALLLKANAPEALGRCYCVEGDAATCAYLRRNTAHLPECVILEALLSAGGGRERALVDLASGSRSAQGARTAETVAFDVLRARAISEPVDVLKTDVDGLDGRVLAGAAETLKQCRPAVIFEWHPILCARADADWGEPFELLDRQGYRRFVWVTKYGLFSHFMDGYDRAAVARLARMCLENRVEEDWHYDVAAVPPDMDDGFVLGLAECRFAKNKPVPF